MIRAVRRAMGYGLACAGLVSLAAILSAQTANAQTPGWQTYSYAADGFSASFPAQPQEQKQNVNTAAGTFELRSYVVTVGQTAMFVGVCDYGTSLNGRDPETALNGAQKGALDNTQAHLISSGKITLGIYPGLAFEAESQAAHFSARVYLVGSTLYQEVVVSPLGQPYADTARFFDSFQLIARTAP